MTYLGSSDTGSNVKRYFDLNKLSRWGISNNDGGPNGHAIPNNANERWSSNVWEGFCPNRIPIRPSISNVYRRKERIYSKKWRCGKFLPQNLMYYQVNNEIVQ
jgi:hypothetical protein